MPSPGFYSCWASDVKEAFTELVDRLGCAGGVRAVDVVVWVGKDNPDVELRDACCGGGCEPMEDE
jgi:hypothetical protein